MNQTDISLEDIQRIIDRIQYLRNELSNLWHAPGISKRSSFSIFRAVGIMKGIENELIAERNGLPIPENEIERKR